MNQITLMPESHRVFLEHALSKLQDDDRIIGVAVGGSFLTQNMDELSDIDLVLAIDPPKVDEVMHERTLIASRLGRLVAAFTGEHVGEPRLLICLYDAPVLHVDLKFVNLLEAAIRVETPAILLDRGNRFATELTTQNAKFPEPDLQWIEDRFWVWVHYAAAKIGRGEIFEAVDFLAFLRLSVLGPLSLLEAGARPSGVRKLEMLAPERAREMRQTLAGYDRQSCLNGLQAAIELYISLRETLQHENLIVNTEAERVAREYIHHVTAKYCLTDSIS